MKKVVRNLEWVFPISIQSDGRFCLTISFPTTFIFDDIDTGTGMFRRVIFKVLGFGFYYDKYDTNFLDK